MWCNYQTESDAILSIHLEYVVLSVHIFDPGLQNQSLGSIFLNWDLYIIWKLNRTISETLESEGAKKNWNIEKITFKVTQMKFSAMHIINKKCSLDMFTVVNLQNIFMEHELYLIS